MGVFMRSTVLLTFSLLASVSTYAQEEQTNVPPTATPPPTEATAKPTKPSLAAESENEVFEQVIPEFFYQPGKRRKSLELGLILIPVSTADTISLPSGVKSGEIRTSGGGVFVRFGYGLKGGTAFGFRVSYLSEKADIVPAAGAITTLKAKGLQDFSLSAQRVFEGESTNFYIGVNGKIGNDKAKQATTTADGNEMSGGWSATPRLGVSSTVATNFTLGAAAEYTHKGDRTVNDNGSPSSDYTYKGGNSFTATGLLEYQAHGGTVSASIGVTNADSSSSYKQGVLQSTTKAKTYPSLGVGTVIRANKIITLVGDAGAAFMPEEELSTTLKISSYTVSVLSGAVRMEF